MTNNLKCRFCGRKMHSCDGNNVWCGNIHCVAYDVFTCTPLYKSLVDGKKAQDLLKEIKEDYDFYELKAGEGQNIDWRVLANIFAEKITPITTQEKE